jgi:hypothetical protein
MPLFLLLRARTKRALREATDRDQQSGAAARTAWRKYELAWSRDRRVSDQRHC